MIVKTCGLREADNISALSQLTIDWMGFIFYPKSKRYVEGTEADLTPTLLKSIPQRKVGVFVNATLVEVTTAVEKYELDAVQLHGEETPNYCADIRKMLKREGFAIIKAFRVGETFDFEVLDPYHNHCDFLLFDTKGSTHGGTGQQFNWSLLREYTGPTPFLLSGGIGPEDAAPVTGFRHPMLAGIDINSRFEEVPGRKSVTEVSAFLNKLKK